MIDLPKKIVIGYGTIELIPSVLRELGLGGRAYVITGPNVRRLIAYDVEKVLNEGGINYEVGIVKSSNVADVESLMNEISSFNPSVLIGLGGGKAIDAAKYVSSKTGVPFVSVPTAASHDGIASPFASIRGLGRVTSVKASPPAAIIADINIISKAPIRLLRAGAGDLIGKLTAVLDWRLAHRLKGEYYGEYAASLSLLSAKHILSAAELISSGRPEAVRIVLEGLTSASVAMCIAGSTRPASGSEHLFSHALDLVADYPALHGEQVAIGTIMMSYLHGKNWRRIKATIRRMGLPVTAKELGVKDVQIIEALTKAHTIRPERYTILGETGLTWEAAEALAKRTGVID